MKLPEIIDKKKEVFVLLIISIISLSVNAVWITNYSPEFSNEDTLVLNPTLSLLKGDYISAFQMYQPVIPTIMAIGLRIFSFEKTPLFVNLLFSIPLIIFTYLITKKLFGKKYGLLASFLVISLPGVIAYSRTVYDTFILMSFFSATIYFFILSDFFNDSKKTMLFTLVSILGLLSRYTMVSYIGSLYLFFLIYKLFEYVKNKKNLLEFFEAKSFKQSALSLIIILVVVTPFYVSNFDIQSYFNRNNEFSNVIKESGKNVFLCNTINYPLYLFNYQIGFLVSIVLIVSVIIFLINHKKTDKNIFLLLFILLVNFFFYSYFVGIKHPTVTGIALPLIPIIIAGFFRYSNLSHKKPSIFLIVILILNGIYFLSPFELPNSLNNLAGLSKAINNIDCRISIVEYKVNEDYKFWNKDIRLQKYDLLRYKKRQRLISNITKEMINGEVNIIDLSTYYHYEINYYQFIINNQFPTYYDCNNFDETKIDEIDYALLSEKSYANLTNPWRLYYNEEQIKTCDKYRELIVTDWEKIDSYTYDDMIYPMRNIFFYISPT